MWLQKIQLLCAEFKPYFLKVSLFAAEHFLAIQSTSPFFLDVDDLYARGHHGAILKPGVYSDKQHMNISSSESLSLHLGG